jgi:hypothetical protein
MPHYEVEVNATRMICVKAENEEDAKERACDEYIGEWNEVTAEIEDEFNDVKDAEFIKQYKEQGELLTVNYVAPSGKP